MRRTQAWRVVIGGIAGLLLWGIHPRPTEAMVLYSNFDIGDTFDLLPAWSIGDPVNFRTSDRFVAPAGSFTLDQIDLAISLFQGPNKLDLQLRSDASGLPGATLEAFHFDGAMGPSFAGGLPPLVLAHSLTNPELVGGQPYWITASAPAGTSAFWHFNKTGAIDTHLVETNAPASFVSKSTQGAFRVTGTEGAVPEPASLLLFGLGLFGVAITRLRAD